MLGEDDTDYPTTTAEYRPKHVMNVQPPREDELQTSYARVVTDEANPKGWYGSMSISSAWFLTQTDEADNRGLQSTPWAPSSEPWVRFPAASSARIHTRTFSKVMSA
jgi:hypothetical protein